MAAIRDCLAKGALTRDALIRELADRNGHRRLGKNVASLLDNHVRTAVRRGIAETTDGVMRLAAKSIEQYERAFLKDQFLASLADLSQGFVAREEAVQAFLRWMGSRRLGTVIHETARALINGLIREGRLEVSDSPRTRMSGDTLTSEGAANSTFLCGRGRQPRAVRRQGPHPSRNEGASRGRTHSVRPSNAPRRDSSAISAPAAPAQSTSSPAPRHRRGVTGGGLLSAGVAAPLRTRRGPLRGTDLGQGRGLQKRSPPDRERTTRGRRNRRGGRYRGRQPRLRVHMA